MPLDLTEFLPRLTSRFQWTDKHYKVVIFLILLAGIYLRMNRFLFNRSLWLDEAYLALNIIERTPGQLINQLSYGQVAPIGFLIPVKFLTMSLGSQETVLRLIPLISGIIALLLFYCLANRWLPRWALLVALILFSVSDVLVEYAAQFKQYSSDAAVTLIIVLVAIWFYENMQSLKRLLVFGVVGIVAVWVSHPAAIVLAGIGASLIFLALHRKAYSESIRIAVIAACWFINFATTFQISIRQNLTNQGLLGFWQYQGGFLPLPPTGIREIEESINILVRLFEDPLGFALYSGVVLLFAIGVVDVLQEGGEKIFLISPILVALVFSALRLYPFSGRLLLFAVPLVLLIVMIGMVYLFRAIPVRGFVDAILILAVIGLIMFQPLRNGLARGINPREHEEIRPLIFHLKENYQPGDIIAVYYAAQYAYQYYSYLLEFDQPTPVIIPPRGDAPEKYRQEVEMLRGNRRVWVVFSHKMASRLGAEEPLIIGYFDDIGQQEEMYEETGATLYLYNLNTTSATPTPQ